MGGVGHAPQNTTPAALAYATPVTRQTMSTAWAAALLLLAGLGLLLVGGCFLVGVMLVVTHGWFTQGTRPLTSGELTLVIVLYASAFATLGAGGYLLLLLVRHIRPIIRGSGGR
jgi:hypothetical protein